MQEGIRIPKEDETRVFIIIDEILSVEPNSQFFISDRLFDCLSLRNDVSSPNYGRTPPYDEYNETWLQWDSDRGRYRASFVKFSMDYMRVLNFGSLNADYYAQRRKPKRLVFIDYM